uniref:ABSCISIC ACID-INSENSITIVE 5-like protein 3 n=1 Tax=Cajanus cajan TaxID=3821 RepID=A0A151RY89_CAJCA|nr:ABSCISIC ACID-INSENSITIVE 5-like protein 3 [Cajanus cajan]
MVRQGSLYNLTFDEVQSQLGNTGKSLHSLNLDEIHKTVISAESGQLVQDPSSDHSFILGNIDLNGTISNKTDIGEAWRGMVQQQHVNRSMDTHMQQPNLGETLESFLARAGMLDVGDHDNVNVIDDAQPVMGIDPMVMPSQHEHWLQMQIPGINIHQHHHREQQHQQIIGSCPDFNVSKTFYENPVMEMGYSENSVGISMSPAYSDSKSAVFGKNRYSDEVMEKTIERRQKRMAKNRESAARSRAKKQVSTTTHHHHHHQPCMPLVHRIFFAKEIYIIHLHVLQGAR